MAFRPDRAAGMIVLWYMDQVAGNRLDSSVNNQLLVPGVAVPSVAINLYDHVLGADFTTPVAGNILNLENVNQVADFPMRTGAGTTALTCVINFYRTGSHIATESMLFSGNRYIVSLETITEEIVVQLRSAVPAWHFINSDNPTVLNAWTNIIFRWNGDADDEFAVWINGVKQVGTHIIPLVENSAQRIRMGGTAFTGNLPGYLSETAFWDRALSEEDMQLIYAGGIRAFLNPPDASACPVTRTAAEIVALQETALTGITDPFVRNATAAEIAALGCTAQKISGG